MEIKDEIWGVSPDGKKIHRYTMTNGKGAWVKLQSVGAGVAGIGVPDRDGKIEDVVLGYADPLSYFGDGACAGKCPGRYANRIAGGKFSLDGTEYALPINNGPNHLHGGPQGFANQVWDSRMVGSAVEFMYFSEDGEMGYPGNLKVVAHYEWDEDDTLRLTLTAETDKPTVINLTNHTYFNLNSSGDIRGHMLRLNSSEYLPTDETLIPVGESDPVEGTPMDFRTPRPLGPGLEADFAAIKYGKGYDNCWAIDGYIEGQLQEAAELYAPESGRQVTMMTTQPGVQVYTGNWLEGSPDGKDGRTYHDYDAVAIECQHYPDSPNHQGYPSTVLRPGDVYREAIIWTFSVR